MISDTGNIYVIYILYIYEKQRDWFAVWRYEYIYGGRGPQPQRCLGLIKVVM